MNSPVSESKPTWMVCSKLEGGEMISLSLALKDFTVVRMMHDGWMDGAFCGVKIDGWMVSFVGWRYMDGAGGWVEIYGWMVLVGGWR